MMMRSKLTSISLKLTGLFCALRSTTHPSMSISTPWRLPLQSCIYYPEMSQRLLWPPAPQSATLTMACSTIATQEDNVERYNKDNKKRVKANCIGMGESSVYWRTRGHEWKRLERSFGHNGWEGMPRRWRRYGRV